MNTTFKVVFNKARGALMVVNEITSSVQSKGTKTVVATAVAALIAGVAGVANAENTPPKPDSNVYVSADVKVGDQAITIGTTESTDANYVNVSAKKFTIGKAGESLVINGAKDERAVKVYTPGVEASLIGKTIDVTGKLRAVNATASTLTIGGDNTQSITLTSTDASMGHGAALFLSDKTKTGAKVTMKATDSINIVSGGL